MVYKGYMYGTLLVSDLSISFSIFIVVVFSWLFLRHDGCIHLCSIVCCETDSGFNVKRLLNGEHYERVDVRS